MTSLEQRLNSQEEFVLSQVELESNEFFLTTFDNFFNPFENFLSWFAFDSAKSYNSSGLLSRVAAVPMGLSPNLEKRAIVEAMHTIVRLHNFEIYRILVKPSD